MKARDLLEQLQGLTDDELDLYVVTVGCNTAHGEGVTVIGSLPGPHPAMPSPLVEVAALDAEISQVWATRR